MSDESQVNELPESFVHPTEAETPVQPAMSQSVEQSVTTYLSVMKGQNISDLYELVLSEVEEPLLTAVMKATSNNQSRASTMLGLNRGTLRKKLKKYGIV